MMTNLTKSNEKKTFREMVIIDLNERTNLLILKSFHIKI